MFCCYRVRFELETKIQPILQIDPELHRTTNQLEEARPTRRDGLIKRRRLILPRKVRLRPTEINYICIQVIGLSIELEFITGVIGLS